MTRIELANLFAGKGAELGVAAGEYSDAILRNPRVTTLYSIDRWTDHHDAEELERAKLLLQPFGDRSVIVRASFQTAVESFPDSYFDFLYLDGYAHTGQEHGRTFEDWYPKLKPGGIFAGHDYCDHQYPQNVIEVDWFADKHGLSLSFTESDDLPSWYAIKP